VLYVVELPDTSSHAGTAPGQAGNVWEASVPEDEESEKLELCLHSPLRHF
jgi:hypothetical protein